MAASVNDNLDQVTSSTTGRPVTATLSAPGHSIAGTSIGLNVATNWTTTTGIHFSIYATTTVGSLTVKDTATQTDWKGTLSGTTISNMTLTGGTDQDYAAGAIVEITPTARYAKDLYTWAVAQHNQDGSHAAITATSLSIASQTWASLITGWLEAAVTWTYASGATTNVGTFTITGDYSGIYQAGDKVQFTQTTVKYGIITKVSYSNPSTTVTIYMGTDYTIANAAISANYYSKVKSPQGFPIDPAKWTITTTSSNDRTTSSTSYASLTDNIVVPIGCWNLQLKAVHEALADTTTTRRVFITLSSDASTETNPQTTCVATSKGAAAAANAAGSTVSMPTFINLAASTTFTLMGKTSNSAATCQVIGSSSGTPTVIRATCAYI